MAIENIAIEIRSNAREIESQLSEIDSRLRKLKNDKPQIELKAEKLENAKKRIDSINLQLKELAAKKADIKANTKDVDEAKKKIAEVNDRMNKLRSVKANLQVTTERLKGADKDLKNLNKEMQQLNNKKARLQVDADSVQQSESRLDRLRSRLQQLGNTRTKIDVSANIQQLGTQLDGIGSKMLNLFNPLTSQLNQLIGVGAALKAISTAVNMIKGSVDGAITRFDTLNNFPKTMSNLQISAEDSQKAIDTLGDKLTGLPTTLNDAALSVQRFTSKNEDIGKSTNMFLALNNAILSGGASTDIQSSALEQLSQAYSKGSIDMMEWRTALSAMPAQMSQVAKSFGMTSDELGESLRNGDKSMDEFMERIMEMNETGIEGFKSFSDQAKNAVGGIRTSMKTMGSAITRGVTKNIEVIDKILQNAGLDGLTGVFSKIGSAFEGNLKKAAGFLEENQEKIITFVNIAKDKFSELQKKLSVFDWKAFGSGIKEGFTSMASAGKSFLNSMKPVVTTVKDLITKFGGGSFEKGLGRLIPLFLKAAVGAKVLGKSFQVLSKFKLPSFSFGGGGSGAGGGLTSLTSSFAGFAKNAGNLTLIFGAIKVLQELAEALKQINEKVPGDLGSLQPKFIAMAEAITGIGVVAFAAGKLPTGTMLKGLALVAGATGDLMLTAQALQDINTKVSSNLGDLQPKLLAMGEALGAMGTFALVVGGIASTGWGGLALVLGEFLTAGLAGNLMLTAQALQDINNKVPSDLKGIRKKLEVMGEALEAVASDSLFAGLQAIQNFVGMFDTMALTKTLDMYASTGESLEEIGKIKVDLKAVRSTIKGIQSIMDVLKTSSGLFGEAAKSLFGGKIDTGIAKRAKKAIDGLNELGEAIVSFEKVTIPDLTDIENKISDIQNVFGYLQKTEGLWGDADHFFNGGSIDTKISKTAKKAIDNLVALADSIAGLKGVSIDQKSIEKSIEEIQSVFGYLKKTKGFWSDADNFFNGGSIDSKISKTAKKAIDNLVAFAKSLTKLPEVDPSGIRKKINSIQNLFDSLEKTKGFGWDFGAFFGGGKIDTSTSTKAKTAMENLVAFAQSLVTIPEVDTNTVAGKIRNIQSLFEVMNTTDGWFGDVGTFFFGGDIDTSTAEKAQSYVSGLTGVVEAMNGLPENFDSKTISKKITDIQSVFDSFLTEGNLLERWGSFFTGGDIDTGIVEDAQDYITKIVEISDSFKELMPAEGDAEFDASTIEKAIKEIQSVFSLFDKEKSIFEKGWDFIVGGDGIDTTVIDQIADATEALSKITENEVDYNAISEQLRQMKWALETIGKFEIGEVQSEVDLSGYEAILEKLEPVAQLLDTLSDVEVDYNAISEQLRQIKWALGAIAKFELDGVKSELDLAAYDKRITSIQQTIDLLLPLVSQAIDYDGISEQLRQMKWALNTIASFAVDELDEKLNLKMYNDRIEDLKETIDLLPPLTAKAVDYNAISEQLREMKRALTTIAELELTEVAGNVNSEAYIGRIKKIQEIIDVLIPLNDMEVSFDKVSDVLHQFGMALSSVKNLKLPEFPEGFDAKGDAENFTVFSERIDDIQGIIDKLNGLVGETVDEESFNTLVNTVDRMMNKLAWFTQAERNFNEMSFTSIIEDFKTLITQLNNLKSSFNDTGGTLAEGVISGFKAKDVPGSLLTVINTAVTKLRSKYETFRKIGETYGTKLKNAFSTAVKGMHKGIDPEITSLNGYKLKFEGIGTTFGTSIADKFSTAISEMSSEMSKQVTKIQDLLDTLEVPNLNPPTGSDGKVHTASTGGEVPKYLATGGIAGIFKKKGTDTIPAMLTPGEYVQRKAAVSTFGLDFMNRVNNLDIQGAFQSMTKRFGTPALLAPSVATTVNNINTTNTNNAKVVQNINSDSQNYNGYKKLNRFVRNL